MTDSAITADREELFAKLADPATTGKFFERVSDSVSWTVEGTRGPKCFANPLNY